MPREAVEQCQRERRPKGSTVRSALTKDIPDLAAQNQLNTVISECETKVEHAHSTMVGRHHHQLQEALASSLNHDPKQQKMTKDQLCMQADQKPMRAH